MSRYKLVIFDLDGTLLDTTEGVLSAIQYSAVKCGLLPLPMAQMKRFIEPTIQESFRKMYGIEEKNKLQKLAMIFRERYKSDDLYKAKPYAGIYQTCEKLQNAGILLAVATYKQEEYAADLLRYFGFDKYMSAIYGADREYKLKKVDIISKCLYLLGNPKDQNIREKVVMVGDTESDKLGAKCMNIDFIGVTYGFGFRDSSEIALSDCLGVVDSAGAISGLII